MQLCLHILQARQLLLKLPAELVYCVVLHKDVTALLILRAEPTRNVGDLRTMTSHGLCPLLRYVMLKQLVQRMYGISEDPKKPGKYKQSPAALRPA